MYQISTYKSGKFKERYKLVFATTLVDINIVPTCKVRVMNPFTHDADLRHDAEIGIMLGEDGTCNSVLSKAE